MPSTLDARSVPRLLLIVVGLVSSPAVGRSQEGGSFAPGARVRVHWTETAQRHRAVGRVLELRTDALVLAQPAGPRTFALTRLDRIDVRVPRSRLHGALRGAELGTLAGLAAGLAVGALTSSQCPPTDDMCGITLLVGPVLGFGAGLTLGTVIGAVFPGEEWQRIRSRGRDGAR
jgi:hypothetical protein